MATASLTTLQALLKNFYSSPVRDAINNELEFLGSVEKSKFSWNGEQCIIPIRVGRNSGVGTAAEGGNLPTAGSQEVKRMTVGAKYVYGRFQISGPARAAAAKEGAGAFVSAIDFEMKKLVEDVRNGCQRMSISGQRVVGFANEHKTTTGAGTTTWQFAGDHAKLTAALAAKGGDIKVQLIDLSDYTLTQGAGTIDLSAHSQANGTITLDNTDSAAADVDTTGVDTGFGIAVYISDTDPSLAYLDTEPAGVYQNLAQVDHFGVSKATYSVIRPVILTQSEATTHARADLTLDRLQVLLDTVANESGSECDEIWMNKRQRHTYQKLVQANLQSTVDGKPGVKDGGVGTLEFGGRPIKTSRHVDRGLLLCLTRASFELAELKPGDFEDEDGNILSRVSGKDEMEGYWKWYYQLVAVEPQKNGVLVGLNF